MTTVTTRTAPVGARHAAPARRAEVPACNPPGPADPAAVAVLCQRAGRLDLAAALIPQRLSAAQVRQRIAEADAAAGEAPPPGAALPESPLLRLAREEGRASRQEPAAAPDVPALDVRAIYARWDAARRASQAQRQAGDHGTRPAAAAPAAALDHAATCARLNAARQAGASGRLP